MFSRPGVQRAGEDGQLVLAAAAQGLLRRPGSPSALGAQGTAAFSVTKKEKKYLVAVSNIGLMLGLMRVLGSLAAACNLELYLIRILWTREFGVAVQQDFGSLR